MLARGNPSTRVVVGLGNEGRQYVRTRHNAGALAVARAAERLGLAVRAGLLPIPLSRSGLVLPSGFMNESGGPVRRAVERWRPTADGLLVVHDDLDLPLGSVQPKDGGGHGGHNCLRDVQTALGTGTFQRLRIGIGRPPGRQDPADYVLGPFTAAEMEQLEPVLEQAVEEILNFLQDGRTVAGS
jgi:peptidyl-tRNA hydrolase, PTH1 family